MNRLFFLWSAVLLLLLICLFRADFARAEGVLELGMSAAFTGPSRGLGIELYRGSKTYFDYINREEGGLFGKKIVIKALDDGYNPDPAIHNTIRFIGEDEVLLLFDYVGTPTVTRVLPLLKKYSKRNMYLFFPFTGAQPQREEPYGNYVYNLRASYRQECSGLVDRFVSLGRTRIAVFYQADAYGRSGWDGVRLALSKHDLKIVGEATYSRGTLFSEDMGAQVRIITESKPDAVISIGSYEACAAFIRDARHSGLEAPIANLSFVGSVNLLKLLDDECQKTQRPLCADLINSQVVPSFEDLSLPAVQEYRRLMEESPAEPPAELINEEYTPLKFSFVSFEGFLNAKVLVSVLKRFGKIPSREQIRQVMVDIERISVGIDTPVRFGPGRHQGLDEVYFTTVENGKFVPITDWNRWAK